VGEVDSVRGFGAWERGADAAGAGDPRQSLPYGVYDKADVTVSFCSLNYDILTDEQAEADGEQYPELKRYLTVMRSVRGRVGDPAGEVVFDSQDGREDLGGCPGSPARSPSGPAVPLTGHDEKRPLDFVASPTFTPRSAGRDWARWASVRTLPRRRGTGG